MGIENSLFQISQKQDEILAMLKGFRNGGVVDNKDSLYDLTDLEKKLHVSRRTLFKYLSAGILGHSKIGKKIYVSEKELQQFLVLNKQCN
jgi:hypothetical protein